VKKLANYSKKMHIGVQYHLVRYMIEDKNVLLVKVNTLNNVADSLIEFVNSEKLSCCRETMGITALDYLSCTFLATCMQRKQQVKQCWVFIILIT